MHRRHLFHVINFYQNDLIIIRCVSLCRKREKIVYNIQSQRKNSILTAVQEKTVREIC